MTYYLYIDVLFFVNFIMNFLTLILVRMILKYRRSILRVAAGSAVGALWACLTAIFPVMPRPAELFVTCTLASGLMVRTAFGISGIRELIKGAVCFFLCAAALGGSIYALYQHTRAGYYVEQLIRGRTAEALPVAIWILLIAGAYFGTKYIWITVTETRRRRNHLYRVTLHYRGKVKVVTAFLDTGNRLHAPVSMTPVHVITYEACRQFCDSVTAVIYIPFQTVGNSDGMIPGIFIDAMDIEQGGETKTIPRPLLAVCKEPLSADGSYQMLLNEDIE